MNQLPTDRVIEKGSGGMPELKIVTRKVEVLFKSPELLSSQEACYPGDSGLA